MGRSLNSAESTRPANPRPPSWEELSQEERTARALVGIGCATETTESLDRRVYDAMLRYYAGQKGKNLVALMPFAYLVRQLAPIAETSLQSAIARMLKAGSIHRPRRGFYVPLADRRPG